MAEVRPTAQMGTTYSHVVMGYLKAEESVKSMKSTSLYWAFIVWYSKKNHDKPSI